MSRKWLVFALLVMASVSGCVHRDRPGLLARIRGQSAASYTDPYYQPPTTPYYPSVIPAGGNGNGACCNGVPLMSVPGAGMGTMPGVTEQFPGPYPGSNPMPMLPAGPPTGPGGDQAKPLPAGPSTDMMKGTRPGRVTNMPDGK